MPDLAPHPMTGQDAFSPSEVAQLVETRGRPQGHGSVSNRARGWVWWPTAITVESSKRPDEPWFSGNAGGPSR
jgi:hypothetical protein